MRTLSSLLMLLVFTFTAATAAAKPASELVRHVPAASPLILGFEMSKVKSSVLFSEVMSLLQGQAAKSSLLSFVLSKKAFDVEQDIHSAVVGFESTPTNPQGPPPSAMAVVDGTFDAQRVKDAVTAEFGKLSSRKLGTLEVFSAKGVEFSFVDPTTLVIAERAFAAQTWKAVNNVKHAATSNANMAAMLKLTDTTRGLWFTMDTQGLPTRAGTPAMDGAGLSLDLRSGLSVDFRTRFAKAADAKKAKKQFDEMQKTSTNDPMVMMLGAKPLVDNLKSTIVKDRVLAMETSMKDPEVRSMLMRLKALNQAPPPIAPSTQPGTKPTTTPPPPPVIPGEGSKADFN